MKPSRPSVRLGREVRGQGGEQASGEPRGVDELAGREAGVDVDAVDRHDHLGAGEGLVLQLAHGRAVQRVGAARPEALDVEERGALADLLVGREADAQGRARQLGVRGQVGDRGHDLGDAGLVVGAEQRVAARGDDVVALLAGQLGHRGRVEHRAVARQLDRGRRRRRGGRSARRRRRARPGSCRRGRSGRPPACRRRRCRGAWPSRSRCRRARRPRAPMAVSSSTSIRDRSSWPGVLGVLPLPSRRDWVSTRT